MSQLPPLPRVTQQFMNDDHDEAAALLTALVQQLADGNTDEVTRGLDELLKHNREHFAREEAEMVRINFPPYGCHKGEHERVLAEMEQEISVWNAETDSARLHHYLTDTVVNWLQQHISSMDTVTAMFISQADNR